MKGNIEQRSPGSWTLRFDLGVGPDGKRKQKRVTVRGTKKDAEKELARMLHELNTGVFVEPSKMTVGEYLARWLTDCARQNVAPKTFERYEEIAEKHLIPALGRYPLEKLSALHVQGYYSQALESGRRDGKGGLSPQTVLHHHRVLREALGQAVRWGLVIRNVATLAEPPRPPRAHMCALNEEETARLMRAARDTSMHTPVVLALATGLRRGELLALRWEDVDFTARTLTVCRALEATKDGLRFKQPKTKTSRRTLSLPAFAVEALVRHRGKQAEEKLRLGPEVYRDQGLILAGADGSPMHPDSLTTGFRRLARKVGLPTERLHDLRHSHASHLIKQGVHTKVISERLGHASVAITLDTYGHLLAGVEGEAAEKIDAMFRAAL